MLYAPILYLACCRPQSLETAPNQNRKGRRSALSTMAGEAFQKFHAV